ncbi:MAG: ABC transporter permease [Succinivibrionaceae bacterium]
MSRNPFTSTLMVWKALFLKDALSRFFGSRGAWAWLLIEPVAHILGMSFIYALIKKGTMGGVAMQLWIMTGMLSFFLFRRTAVQVLHGIDCNRAFFAFRQVRPFDAAICKAGVEAFSMFWVAIIIAIAFMFAGFELVPDNILIVLTALLGLWLLGLGYGLVSSVMMRLVPDSGFILQIIMMPLMIISGIILPISSIPEPYRDYLLYNPLLHGIEVVRLGFWESYHTVDVSMSYLYFWTILLLVLGLALYRALETRLVIQ